jgi:O-methyltransferase
MKPEIPFDAAGQLKQLAARLEDLHSQVSRQKKEIADLQLASRQQRESSQIFEKAFRVIGFVGDYVEFGAFRGDSLIQAYFAAQRVFEEINGGAWNHAFDDASATRSYFQAAWSAMRFIAFDSFEGIPEPQGVDTIHRVFEKGTYACSEKDFRANIRNHGIPDARVVSVPGFFRDTLTAATAGRLKLKRISVLHIDSELYESARDALQFCTPFFENGTILVFDEWYQFYGHPELGEQRAFREWLAAHPDWIATPFQKEGAFRNSFILSQPQTPGQKPGEIL